MCTPYTDEHVCVVNFQQWMCSRLCRVQAWEKERFDCGYFFPNFPGQSASSLTAILLPSFATITGKSEFLLNTHSCLLGSQWAEGRGPQFSLRQVLHHTTSTAAGKQETRKLHQWKLICCAWLWFWWPWGVASTTMWPNPCLQQWRQWQTKVEVCIFVKAWQLLFKLFVFVNVVRQIVRPCLWKQNLRITQRQVDWHGKLRSRDVDFYCQRCGLPKKNVHQPFWGSITPSPQTSKWRHEWGDIIFSLFL